MLADFNNNQTYGHLNRLLNARISNQLYIEFWVIKQLFFLPYVYVYVYVHVHIYICVCVCERACVRVCIYVFIIVLYIVCSKLACVKVGYSPIFPTMCGLHQGPTYPFSKLENMVYNRLPTYMKSKLLYL